MVELGLSGSGSPAHDVRSSVVFIHGTYARGAKWPDLERAVHRALPHPIDIDYFEWPHWNEVWFRSRGAQDLSEYLQSRLRQFPNAKHHIIAHSHGGNVAIDAILLANIAGAISTLVTLSTPFVLVRPRRVDPSTHRLWAATLGYIGFGALLPALDSEWATRNDDLLGFVVLAPFAIAFMILGIMSKIASMVSRRLPDRGSSVADIPLKIVRYEGDEALMGLAAAQLLSWGVSWIADRVARWSVKVGSFVFRQDIPTVPLKSALIFVGFTWGALAGLSLLFDAFGVDQNSGAAEVVLAVFFLAGAFGIVSTIVPHLFRFAPFLYPGAFVALLLALILIPITVLWVFVALMWGVEIALALIFLDVSADVTPPGEWTIRQIQRPVDSSSLLYHSLSYQHPEAISQIVTWLKPSSERL